MLKRTKWIPIAVVLMLLQLAADVLAMLGVYKLGMFPTSYLIIAGAVMLILLMICGIILFSGLGKGPGHKRRRRRFFGIILSVLITGLVGYGAFAVVKANQTLASITEPETSEDKPELQAMVGVYVKSDNSAQELADSKAYTFGVMQKFDPDNTSKALTKLNEELGAEIKTEESASMTELADALLSGKVDAIVMNEAFVGALEDTDEYAEFENQTRVLHEVPIEKTEEPAAVPETVSAETSETEEAEAEQAEEPAAEPEQKVVSGDITTHPFAIYVSGSDTRSTVLTTSRSDVNIIVVVNPLTRQILLLNTPRDYYVANPAGGGAMDKLTHCGIYGIDCSMGALENLYDFKLDHYVQINFTGFEKLIDTLGGVTVDVPENFSSHNNSGMMLQAGVQTLNGAQALALARERYSFNAGDNARGQNQMRVISAVIDKLSSSGATLLTNYGDILNSLQGMFVTDLSAGDIASLVKMQLAGSAGWNVKSYAVTGQGGSEHTYSMPNTRAYVMFQDAGMVDRAKGLIDKVENNEVLTDEDVQ